MDKNGLRTFFKESSGKLTTQEKISQSQNIMEKLVSYLEGQTGVWSLFSPLGDEPQLLRLLNFCCHLDWAFPVVKSQNEPLEFYKVLSVEQMKVGSYGVIEPDPSQCCKVLESSLKGFIVPGVAFDTMGTRLGRGAGFYDRTLKKINGLRIGVTYDSGLTEFLPKESHDQKMDIIASSSDWLEIDTTEFKKEVNDGV